MRTQQQDIYEILFMKRYNDLISERATKDKATRCANIYAVRWTTKAWQRQMSGSMKNLYRPEVW